MVPRLRSLLLFLLALSLATLSAFGQGSLSAIAGTVKDASGGVVPGVDITVKNEGTGAENSTVSAANGTFNIPALPIGLYTLKATTSGFKQFVATNLKLEVGVPATVNIQLEVGAQSESVIVTSGAEVLQTQSANVATTIQGRQIIELPFTSRDALDLVLLLPGTTTPGRPRTSSVNGLPKGALNITIDGLNVQDNLLKSSDGFFTYIRPRIDAIEEVTVSTATPGAESSAEGAVQIKFVTRGGSNDYHGGLYWYHRNPALNANYWFNNRDLPPDPRTGKAPRDRVLLNQYGFKLGGPISIPPLFNGRDKAFFFVNWEAYRLPEQTSRNRTILSEAARGGLFRYNTSSGVRSVDLYALAAGKGHTSTPDPVIGKLLADIRAATGTTGAVSPLTDPNLENYAYIANGGQDRYFPTVRFDFNITTKHHLENVWNYQIFDSVVDFLNNTDPRFPGFPNFGSQSSLRWSNTTALRSTLRPTLIHEARFGLQGGTTLFFGEIGPGQFANQGGFNLGIGAAGITTATASSSPQRRNSPVKQFSDTLTWIKGTHSLNFGFSFTQINLWSNTGTIVPSISLGVDTTDPADSMFVSANFPGASSSDISRARGIYATLVGRVTAIGATAYLSEDGRYEYLGRAVQRARQREMGMFVSDSWRWSPNLTLNYGLRWEVQFPFTTGNKYYAQTTYDQLFGVSGAGNLFKPGTLAGKETAFTAFLPGDKAFPTKYKNFAPSFGFAWSPNVSGGLLGKIFGSGSTSVFRGGYSVAFNREGTNVVSSILGSNPGGSLTASRNLSLGNLGTLPLLFRETSRLGPPTDIPDTPSYPITGAITNSANAFDPNLRLGYVQSWTFGFQREINKNTVVEVRYTGNHGTKLWRQYSLNEINVIENGFLGEFKAAMQNLQANIAAGRGQTFAYFGSGSGTAPLPTFLAYFSGVPASQAGDASKYNSSNFRSSTYINNLGPLAAAPQSVASSLYGNSTQRDRAAAAGIPANFFLVNPGKLGGAWTVDNGGSTRYDAMTVELRRRMASGLLLQGSYTWGKGITDMFGSSSAVAYSYLTLRKTGLNRTLSPWDVTHAFKANWIWELPIGRGKVLYNGAGGVMDRIVGGWEFHGTARVQSGTPFSFGNVDLVGMSVNDLRKAVQIRHDDANKITYYLPQDIIDNTRRAFNYSATGYSALGAPAGRYIKPANQGCIPSYGGECGYSYVILYGPSFTRYDLSAVKRIQIREQTNVEIRAEFLNAFNNINFRVGAASSDVTSVGGFGSATFGQTREAYRDTSTTNDPGGRLVQFVLRINF